MQLKQQTPSSSQQQRLGPWFMELDWSISSLQIVDFSWCPLCRHVEEHGLLTGDPALMAFFIDAVSKHSGTGRWRAGGRRRLCVRVSVSEQGAEFS